ncbi:tetratricopeptide repeat protein [Roseomonas sp. JC162]|uniref:Tetratricopeptide repeat protein n=1 Tax=Neoroseomonas marina TaxID=1232220 RepID=A0A848EGC5_9PROT|nr:tetratricopeptide repeat protein [Neoroseomonas marina]NMJ42455.1 tetratricopeptide repeat protein [Neoroseomonas marina]
MRHAFLLLSLVAFGGLSQGAAAQAAPDPLMAACERRGGETATQAIMACGGVIRARGTTEAQRARAHGLRALARLDAGDRSGLVEEDLDAAVRLGDRSVPVFLEHAARKMNSSLTSDVDAALRDFDAVLGLEPLNSVALMGRATIRTRRGEMEAARADLNAAVDGAPADPAPRFTRGVLLSSLGETVAARQDLDEAIRLDPRFWQAYGARATEFLAIGDVRRALADYDTALRLHPRGGTGHLLTMRCAARHRAGDVQGAMRSCQEALEATGTRYAPTQLVLAGVALSRGDLAEASTRNDAALALAPGYRAALALRGRLRARQGNAAGATEDLASAGEPGLRQLVMFFGTDFAP